MLNGKMTPWSCHRTVDIRAFLQTIMAATSRFDYNLKGPQGTLVIQVDRDTAVRLDTSRLSIFLSFKLYLTFFHRI